MSCCPHSCLQSRHRWHLWGNCEAWVNRCWHYWTINPASQRCASPCDSKRYQGRAIYLENKNECPLLISFPWHQDRRADNCSRRSHCCFPFRHTGRWSQMVDGTAYRGMGKASRSLLRVKQQRELTDSAELPSLRWSGRALNAGPGLHHSTTRWRRAVSSVYLWYSEYPSAEDSPTRQWRSGSSVNLGYSAYFYREKFTHCFLYRWFADHWGLQSICFRVCTEFVAFHYGDILFIYLFIY